MTVACGVGQLGGGGEKGEGTDFVRGVADQHDAPVAPPLRHAFFERGERGAHAGVPEVLQRVAGADDRLAVLGDELGSVGVGEARHRGRVGDRVHLDVEEPEDQAGHVGAREGGVVVVVRGVDHAVLHHRLGSVVFRDAEEALVFGRESWQQSDQLWPDEYQHVGEAHTLVNRLFELRFRLSHLLCHESSHLAMDSITADQDAALDALACARLNSHAIIRLLVRGNGCVCPDF